MDLKICSSNCCSLTKNIDIVRDLASQDYDLLFLQETFVKSDIWETQTLHDYLDTLSQLGNLVTELRYDSIYFIGDFNADPFSGRSWSHLKAFMHTNHLKCFDIDMLDVATFTFVPYGNAYTK